MSEPGRLLAALAALGALAALTALPREARAEQRTWSRLTTGNGHGFQIFDADQRKITQFLEHPYRYLAPQPGAPPPTVPQGDGVGRRNLAFDVFFGVRGGGGAGWLSQSTSADAPEYVDQTNIIRAPASVAGVNAESFFFAPFGLERNVMVGLLHAPGATDGAALFNFHMGNGRPDPDASGESTTSPSAGVVVERGPGGGAMVYVALSAIEHADCQGPFGKLGGGLGDVAACSGNDIAVGFQGKLQSDWLAVAVGYTDDPNGGAAVASDIQTWGRSRAPDKLLADARAEWDAWRKPPPAGTALCSDAEKKVWRMSEATLRMGQVREPNIAGRKNHGMLLASLPYGEWHSGWVRDAQYALVALARMGHADEAKMALDFFLNAEPVGKYKSLLKPGTPDYRVSVVRYFGTGEEEADYSGQNTPNVELDGWGMVLWSARQYVDASNDTAWLSSATRSGSVYEVLTGGVAAPLAQNLESNGIVAADSGIWEVHDQNKRHFAYTTLAAARGFCDMAAIAKRAGNAGDVTKYGDLSRKVKTGFLAAFADPQGALAGSIEGLSTGKYRDGAVAEAFTWNVLDDWKGATAKATLDALGKLRVDSGGYKRNDDGLSSYDNNEWILVDLRVANALRRAGRDKEGDGVLATVVQKAAANFYLLPELYNAVAQDGQIGKYTGSIPMVGYGGGAFVLTMLDRSGLIEPNDCGDGKGATLPKVDCAGVSTTPGTGGPGDGDGGAGNKADGVPDASQIPFVGACLCRLGPDRGLPPLGLALILASPVVLLVRRKVRP